MFTCSVCNEPKPVHASGATGYAININNEKVCYDCCAVIDRQWMIDGKDPGLYLTRQAGDPAQRPLYRVGNWCGTLTFETRNVRTWTGRGFGYRYPCAQAWFTGPDGKPWSIRVQGDMQLGRAKRIGAVRS